MTLMTVLIHRNHFVKLKMVMHRSDTTVSQDRIVLDTKKKAVENS